MMNMVRNNDILSAENTINIEIDAILELKNLLDENLSKALDMIENAHGRIILTGMGKSGHIAKKISASLASTGTPSFYIHPAEASHGDLGMVTEEDVIIAISNSGESKELIDILNYSKRFGIKLIAITKNPESSLGKAGDIVLRLPAAKEAGPLGLAPTSSTTATLVLGDILTVAMIERRGLSKAQFNDCHPGGKLGSILQRVKDLMHTDSAMPILDENADINQIILEMTSKRLGCVGFVDSLGNLSGMFTDGDLRRCINQDLKSVRAKDIMTKNPITIDKDMFCSQAVKIMNQKQITNLFVLEDKKPIGVIHIHDLLKSGTV